ncbi:hypothetical protein KJ940_15800, partial [Myxococcota bacterium]|nr:hypothetical protein [Myxococcota bacterium]
GGDIGGGGGDIGGGGGDIGGGGGDIGGGGGGGDIEGACDDIPVLDLNNDPHVEINGETFAVNLMTTGRNDFQASCVDQALLGADAVIRFVPPRAGIWLFETPEIPGVSTWDTVLSARADCLARATELACNDDYASLRSRLAINALAGVPYYIIIDNLAEWGAMQPSPVRLEVGPAAGQAPQLLSAEAYWIPNLNVLGVRFTASDPNGDGDGIAVQFLDAMGQIMPNYGNATREFLMVNLHPGSDWGTFERNGLAFSGTVTYEADLALLNPARLRIFARDSLWQRSAPQEVALGLPPPIALGQPCDDADPFAVCSADAACIGGTCRAAHAPTLTAVAAYANPLTATVGAIFSGGDEDNDVNYARITLLNAEGQPIPVGAQNQENQVLPFGAITPLGGGNFETRVTVNTGLTPVERVARVRVQLIDETFKESPALEGAMTPPEMLGVGQACDPLQVFERCSPELGCIGGGCVAADPPTISEGFAYHNAARFIGVHILGVDADGDNTRLRVTPRDAMGGEHALINGGISGYDFITQDLSGFDAWATYEARFQACAEDNAAQIQACVSQGDDFLTCRARHLPDLDLCDGARLAQIIELRLTAIDGGGQESAPLMQPLAPTPLVALGDVCDGLAVFAICPEGASCQAQANPNDPWQCAANP